MSYFKSHTGHVVFVVSSVFTCAVMATVAVILYKWLGLAILHGAPVYLTIHFTPH